MSTTDGGLATTAAERYERATCAGKCSKWIGLGPQVSAARESGSAQTSVATLSRYARTTRFGHVSASGARRLNASGPRVRRRAARGWCLRWKANTLHARPGKPRPRALARGAAADAFTRAGLTESRNRSSETGDLRSAAPECSAVRPNRWESSACHTRAARCRCCSPARCCSFSLQRRSRRTVPSRRQPCRSRVSLATPSAVAPPPCATASAA